MGKKQRGGSTKKRDSSSNLTADDVDAPKRLRSIDSSSSARTIHADDASLSSRSRVRKMSSSFSQDSYQVDRKGSCGSGSMMSSNYNNMGFNNNTFNSFT